MSPEQVRDLWYKVFSGAASAEEKQALNQVLADETNQELITQLMDATYDDTADTTIFFSQAEKNAMMQAATGSRQRHSRVRVLWKWAAAAVVTGLLAGSGYYYFMHPGGKPIVSPLASQDTTPGNKAVLTLSNGKKIILDKTGTGELARQSGATVLQLDSGSIAYKGGDGIQNISYNTLTTPPGGQFKLLLPDGTTAWLNAASSITYPTAFTGKERDVTITGEVYLEVAANARQPFMVTTSQQRIAVLGTSFNVNAYTDEASVNTTLLEGSVSVTPLNNAGKAIILRPGQQALYQPQTGKINVKTVNTSLAVAWKNGLFSFEQANIQTVMRQLSRWYNVTVEYEGGMPPQTFSGDIYRNLPLSKALEMLEFVGFKFEVVNNGNDKTIVVRP
ncbi:FecR family protein [Chitinophaga qingshengii]|uniref:FecR family protein n=1 Tax=Chitinophaga qingshengii TaxID=1569794 RepID=A0ABR7TZ87_9BACT|nr:FecR family protein [Chitinophaga qingshengii]MBC9934934.1 FecR family protein [Chitinophaga qingshengii]